MVKKNKLLIGCLALLLVLSVGYALFSETITINGTATAKGSFDITTTCAAGYSDEFIAAMGATGQVTNDSDQVGFANSTCNVNGNVVTMTTDLLYPTAKRFFTVKMTNTGSIPALIWGSNSSGYVESLKISDSYSYSIINKSTDEVLVSGNGKEIHRDGNSYIANYSSTGGFYYVSKTDEIFASDGAIKNVEKNIGGIKLEPGDTLYGVIEFKYDASAAAALKDNGKDEYIQFGFNHEFEWEQYTDSANYESSSFEDWCFMGC